MVGTLALFAQGTLTQALIQRDADVEDAANAALIATTLTGLLLGLAALATAPLAAFLVVFPLEWLLVRSDRNIEPIGIAAVFVECLVFTVVYVAALRVVSPSWYRAVRDAPGRGLATVTIAARRWVV